MKTSRFGKVLEFLNLDKAMETLWNFEIRSPQNHFVGLFICYSVAFIPVLCIEGMAKNLTISCNDDYFPGPSIVSCNVLA